MNSELKITFQPSGRSVFVLPDTLLIEAAARAGLILETPCGGSGRCGKCVVRITAGRCPPSKQEKVTLGPDGTGRGLRLACRCRAREELTVEIPATSLFRGTQKILSGDAGGTSELKPRIRKTFLELPLPGRDDARADLQRLVDGLGPVRADRQVLRSLPGVLRDNDFKVTATVIDDRLVNIEGGDTTARCCGVAFDIGTTTLVGTLVDLTTGADLALVSRVNPQTTMGDDVLARIDKCRRETDGLRELHDAILESVNAMISELVTGAGRDCGDVYEVVVAGNTTMQQLFCGLNPAALGEMPFVPVFRDGVRTRARDLGVDMHAGGDVQVFPQIGGFVGGDTVAGILATGLDRLDKPSLLVDIGTNGELVLVHEGRLTATSVAAGPAFEGARIAAGMRAVPGAIEKVVLDGDLRVNTIGDYRPAGICGTGLIDAAAVLLGTGVLDASGRLLGPDEVPATVPETIRRRLSGSAGHYDFVLVDATETSSGEPLCLLQKDIRELQLANAALRAGINILLKHAGLAAEDLERVLLAGAFGNYVRRENALRIGMLPPVPIERIHFVGNAASLGAKRFLLSADEAHAAAHIARNTVHLDLSLDPEFQDEFGAAMLFPGI